jgi:hypothetical protein
MHVVPLAGSICKQPKKSATTVHPLPWLYSLRLLADGASSAEANDGFARKTSGKSTPKPSNCTDEYETKREVITPIKLKKVSSYDNHHFSHSVGPLSPTTRDSGKGTRTTVSEARHPNDGQLISS